MTEIKRLANYLMANYPSEIGREDLAHGESAVDVSIRLFQQRDALLAACKMGESVAGKGQLTGPDILIAAASTLKAHTPQFMWLAEYLFAKADAEQAAIERARGE